MFINVSGYMLKYDIALTSMNNFFCRTPILLICLNFRLFLWKVKKIQLSNKLVWKSSFRNIIKVFYGRFAVDLNCSWWKLNYSVELMVLISVTSISPLAAFKKCFIFRNYYDPSFFFVFYFKPLVDRSSQQNSMENIFDS